jgi:hypothetical protein
MTHGVYTRFEQQLRAGVQHDAGDDANEGYRVHRGP